MTDVNKIIPIASAGGGIMACINASTSWCCVSAAYSKGYGILVKVYDSWSSGGGSMNQEPYASKMAISLYHMNRGIIVVIPKGGKISKGSVSLKNS